MATDAIRKPLREHLAVQGQLQAGQHVGLMLDRYLTQHDDEHTGAKQLYELAQQCEVSPVYKSAFSRWRQSLQQLEGVRLFTATAASPIAVGLGNESVLEVGLTVHRTYGVPREQIRTESINRKNGAYEVVAHGGGRQFTLLVDPSAKMVLKEKVRVY